MTAARHRIALICAAGEARTALAAYLGNAGFDVHACDELELPSAFGALVLVDADEAASETLTSLVRSWLRRTGDHRVVVVTPKPTAFKDLLARHGERLHVLPAPAFGWDLVDALRAPDPTRPSSA